LLKKCPSPAAATLFTNDVAFVPPTASPTSPSLDYILASPADNLATVKWTQIGLSEVGEERGRGMCISERAEEAADALGPIGDEWRLLLRMNE
jgi:hypothetical protein